MKDFGARIKRDFLHGLLYFMPIALTIYAVSLVLGMMRGVVRVFTVFIPSGLITARWMHFVVELGSLALLLLFILMIGTVCRSVIGMAFREGVGRMMNSIPGVKAVYGLFTQVTDVLVKNRERMFARAVIVDFPRRGAMTIGFVTGESGASLTRDGRELYKVFIPTVPNPTSGFIVMYPKDQVRMTDFSSESAIKLIMSGGIIEDFGDPAPRKGE